jgi:hypothetical protein
VLTASAADLAFRPVPAGGVLRTGDLLRLEATADADGYLIGGSS